MSSHVKKYTSQCIADASPALQDGASAMVEMLSRGGTKSVIARYSYTEPSDRRG